MDRDALLSEARARVRHLKRHLPKQIDGYAMSRVPLGCAPMLCREALAWRMAELSHSACKAYGRDEITTGIVLTRAATECTAAVWYAMEQVRDFRPENYAASKDILTRLWLGSKNQFPVIEGKTVPVPINVMTMLQHADRSCPGILRAYDAMSEYSHNNWAAQNMFRKINHKTSIIDFGHFPGKAATIGLTSLKAGLVVFATAYDKMADLMPTFLDNLEIAVPVGSEEDLP